LKRKDLIKKFKAKGWYTLRNKGSHEVITDGTHTEAIPRHSEINEQLARALIRRWGL
jgi:mRNA interferase HicA